MRALTLLLLSGGGHTGGNVMASLAGRRSGLRLVATSNVPDEPALFAFDAAYLAPTLARDARAFEQRMLDVIARENPDLVVPCRDEDVRWLADLGERRPDLRAKFLCGAKRLAEVANDKWRSFEFCQAHALPFAPSLPAGDTARIDAFVEEHGFPLVAKPRAEADSRGVLILTSAAQVAAAMKRPDYVLQKYIGAPGRVEGYLAGLQREGIPLFHSLDGVKHSLQAMIGPDGNLEHVFCTQIRVTGQGSRAVSRDLDPQPRRIGELCARVFADAGWRGPLNIQCAAAPGGDLMIHEFGVRFTASTHNRWLLGLDEVGAAIRLFTGHAIAAGFARLGTPPAAAEGLIARAADPGSVRILAERGEWTREHA